MEDGTVANGEAPPPSTEESPSQVDVLVKDLNSSKSMISKLEAQVDDYEKERTEFLDKIEQLESKAKVMDSVVARASSLEGDVARLQHDLVSAMSEGEEATAEANQLRVENSALGKKVGTLEERVAVLDGKIAELEAEKSKVLAEGEGSARVLVEKLRKAEQVLGEKDGEIGKAQGLAAQAISEVKVLQRSLTELRESEDKADAGNEEKGAAEMSALGGDYSNLLPYAVTAMSAGTIAAAATVCYLRLSREK